MTTPQKIFSVKQNPVRRVTATALLALAGLPWAPPLHAASTDNETADSDRFNVAVGTYFVTRTNSQIRLDQDIGLVTVGTTIDWETDLGGDTTEIAPRVDGFYRFTPTQRMDYSWYRVNRSGEAVTQRDLEFGNVSFPAGSTINSKFSTNTAKLAYTYSFFRAPVIETGFSLGLHVTQLEASLAATGLGLSESTTTTAPLPVFGFRLDYSPAPRWWVRGRYELFFLDKMDVYRGSLNDFSLAIEHQTFRHVGFSFGLNRNNLDLEVNKDTQRGKFNTLTSGFVFSVVVR
jgi:hypothetical protein